MLDFRTVTHFYPVFLPILMTFTPFRIVFKHLLKLFPAVGGHSGFLAPCFFCECLERNAGFGIWRVYICADVSHETLVFDIQMHVFARGVDKKTWFWIVWKAGFYDSYAFLLYCSSTLNDVHAFSPCLQHILELIQRIVFDNDFVSRFDCGFLYTTNI